LRILMMRPDMPAAGEKMQARPQQLRRREMRAVRTIELERRYRGCCVAAWNTDP